MFGPILGSILRNYHMVVQMCGSCVDSSFVAICGTTTQKISLTGLLALDSTKKGLLCERRNDKFSNSFFWEHVPGEWREEDGMLQTWIYSNASNSVNRQDYSRMYYTNILEYTIIVSYNDTH